MNIALVGIGKALGVNLLPDPGADERQEMALPDDAPTIADLNAEVSLPGPGGDTLAASRAILERLKGGNG